LSLDASAPAHLAFADESCADFTRAIDDYVHETGMDAPEAGAATKPMSTAAREPILELELRSANVTSVIWGTGYGFDFDWVRLRILGFYPNDFTSYLKYLDVDLAKRQRGPVTASGGQR
jgi:putative flavoprotein involved in K+ transport